MYDRRILVLLIERVQEGKELFCHTVPTALRDYAKALDKDNAQKRGHPLKGRSRKKTPLLAKKSPFLLGHNARISTASF